jgi:hypothetical protein
MATANGSDTIESSGAPVQPAASPKVVTIPKPAKPLRIVKKPVKIAKPQREQSTIAFPYRDLDVGVSVAKAIIDAGGVGLTTDQLAGVMGLQAGSGNFVMKVATARMFGLLTNAGGKYELTDTGFAIVDKDDKRQKAARAEAFLKVPLYKRVYDEFRGKQLPPRPHGLEQAFVRFGVSQKQKEAARLAFDKSATQAGFFAAGQDRLIEPIVASSVRPKLYVDEIDLRGEDEQGGVPKNPFEGLGRHPFIQGLLDTLPEPKTNWTVEGRAKWLQAAARCFDLIYLGTGEIQITPRPSDDTPDSKE